MNARLIPITLGAIAFLATLLIARHGAQPSGPSDNTPAPVVAAARKVLNSLSATPQATELSAAGTEVASGDTPDADAPYVPPEPAAEPVPVALSSRNVPGTGQREVLLQNLSTAPLTVRVTAEAGGRQSQAQVDIAPHHRSNLSEAGIVVDGPTTITLSSPPYEDRTLQTQ